MQHLIIPERLPAGRIPHVHHPQKVNPDKRHPRAPFLAAAMQAQNLPRLITTAMPEQQPEAHPSQHPPSLHPRQQLHQTPLFFLFIAPANHPKRGPDSHSPAILLPMQHDPIHLGVGTGRKVRAECAE